LPRENVDDSASGQTQRSEERNPSKSVLDSTLLRSSIKTEGCNYMKKYNRGLEIVQFEEVVGDPTHKWRST